MDRVDLGGMRTAGTTQMKTLAPESSKLNHSHLRGFQDRVFLLEVVLLRPERICRKRSLPLEDPGMETIVFPNGRRATLPAPLRRELWLWMLPASALTTAH